MLNAVAGKRLASAQVPSTSTCQLSATSEQPKMLLHNVIKNTEEFT